MRMRRYLWMVSRASHGSVVGVMLIPGRPRFLDVLSPSMANGDIAMDEWGHPSYLILGILGSHILDMAIEEPT